ncbi:CHAP domain-containing protein, partial [Arthrospira platensis SPKY2]
DLLEKGKSQGFKVTYFTGSEIPKVGDIWVTATSNHPFGHTGIFTKVDKTGSYFTTLEQNVDLNGDALENGGWVREKKRTLYVDGTFTYDNDPNGLIPQTMVGWFTFYEEKTPTVEPNKENQEVDMSHTFEIFIREDGKQFYINLTEGTYYHIPNPKALKTLEAHYKFRFKKSIYKEKVTKAKFDEYVKAFGLKEKTI